jgi:hypothetical protein
MNDKANIHINLWPKGGWTQEELDEFKAVLKKFGPITGGRTSEPRGLGLQITLESHRGRVFILHIVRKSVNNEDTTPNSSDFRPDLLKMRPDTIRTEADRLGDGLGRPIAVLTCTHFSNVSLCLQK